MSHRGRSPDAAPGLVGDVGACATYKADISGRIGGLRAQRLDSSANQQGVDKGEISGVSSFHGKSNSPHGEIGGVNASMG